MALVGNQSRVNFGSGRSWGGLYSTTAGARRECGEAAFINWQDFATAALKYAARPVGYIGGSAYYQAQSAGGISSFNIAQIENSTGNLNLAGGVNLVGTTSILFDVGSPSLILLVDIAGGVTVILTASSDIKGVVDLSGIADASLSVDPLLLTGIAEITGEAPLVFTLSGDLAVALAALGAASFSFTANDAPLTATGNVEGLVNFSVSGNSALTSGINLSGVVTTSLTQSGVIGALAWAAGGLNTSLTGNLVSYAVGELSGDITPNGETILTADAIAASVWAMNMNQSYSATDVMNLLAAVAAGKTSIVDNGDGSFGVVFRDVTDTSDAITATTTGRERTNIAISI